MREGIGEDIAAAHIERAIDDAVARFIARALLLVREHLEAELAGRGTAHEVREASAPPQQRPPRSMRNAPLPRIIAVPAALVGIVHAADQIESKYLASPLPNARRRAASPSVQAPLPTNSDE